MENQTKAPIKVGELELRPLTLGTITTLAKIGSSFAQDNPSGAQLPVSLEEIAVAVLVFAKPAWCHQMIKAGKRDDIMAAAEDLAFEIDAETMNLVMDYINGSLAEFFAKSKNSPLPEPEVK